jgi:hypothetical protein
MGGRPLGKQSSPSLPFSPTVWAGFRESLHTQKTELPCRHDGLLKENPPQMRSRSIRVEHKHIIVSKLITPDNMVVTARGISTILTKITEPHNNKPINTIK